MCKLFNRKKKIYKIIFTKAATYTVLIEARNEFHALRKFYKIYGIGITPSIISFSEYTI